MPNKTTPHPAMQAYSLWARTGAQSDAAAMLRALDPVLRSAVTTYAGRDDPTAYSRAKLLALKALRTYNPDKSRLSTYLMHQLQPLRRFAAKRLEVVNVPERVKSDGAALASARAALTDGLDRTPTLQELADKTGISAKRIRHVEGFRPVAVEVDEYSDEPTALARQRRRMELWQDYVYHDLDPVDKRIFEQRTGYLGSKVQSVSAVAKALRVTPGAVSQRADKIAKKLQEGESLAE